MEQLAKLNGDYVNINKNIDTSKDILKDISTEDLKSLLNDVDWAISLYMHNSSILVLLK